MKEINIYTKLLLDKGYINSIDPLDKNDDINRYYNPDDQLYVEVRTDPTIENEVFLNISHIWKRQVIFEEEWEHMWELKKRIREFRINKILQIN